MASEAAESSRAREEAAEREASEAVAREPQRSWFALSSIPVVIRGANDARAQAVAPGAADLLLELHDPPRASYLVLPERLLPNPRSLDDDHIAFIIAAAPDVLFLMLAQDTDTQYFLCNVSDGTTARLPAVPADISFTPFECGTTGLVADPHHPGHYMIAQLRPQITQIGPSGEAMKRYEALLYYSTVTGQWSVKQLASAPDHAPWGAHGVIAHGGLLWWVDVAYGILFCDPFDDRPRLRLVPLPTGSEIDYMKYCVRPIMLLDQRRFIRPSKGMLRFVEIHCRTSFDQAKPGDIVTSTITMWTLVDPEGPHPWRFDFEAPFEDMLHVATNLRQYQLPNLALVDPNNHDVVYFFQDTALFALDVRARRVLACEECLVDRVLQDRFQFSRFIRAWEPELPPTSSVGGSGTKRPEPDEELDAATGSDEEMASLLRQMVVKSQPDKEHSSSEAEAGDQAGKP